MVYDEWCIEQLLNVRNTEVLHTKLPLKKARDSALPQICSTPQLAYLPGRGTHEAISRAANHCLDVTRRARASSRPVERELEEVLLMLDSLVEPP